MNRSLAVLLVSALAAILLAAGCSAAPAAPTKVAEPTKAAAPAVPASAAPTAAPAQPSAAPAKKADWPEKGKAINVIVPYAAGGTTGLAARVLAGFMEKDLGVPVQVVDKPGAASQTGLTEFIKSKPDGYTLAYFMLQNAIPTYLDPDRKAVYARKDFKPLAMVGEDSKLVVVRADSPYRTVTDLVEAAKASPEKIKFGASGVMSETHLWVLSLERASGAKFATVQFDGVAQYVTALQGGHVDFVISSMGGVAGPIKANQLRAVALADRQPSALAPGVPTIESQGFKVYSLLSRIVAAPAGTSTEVAGILTRSIERAMQDPDQKKRITEMSMEFRYMGPEQTAAYWEEVEKNMAPIVAAAKQQ